MKKNAHTIYLNENISKIFSEIPKNYRSTFINEVLGDYFKKNQELVFKIKVNIPNENIKDNKIEKIDLNEDEF